MATSRKESLIGRMSGKLKVIAESEKGSSPSRLWLCRCECGQECICSTSTIISSDKRSCGCAIDSTKRRDLTNRVFGKLTVIRRGPNKGVKTTWYCNCSCGTSNILVRTGNLSRSKNPTRSCGCELKQNKIDVLGKRYGSLLAKEQVGKLGDHKLFKCLCDCGKEINVIVGDLTSGRKSHCGCKTSQLLSESAKKRTKSKNPNWKGGITSVTNYLNSKERSEAKIHSWRKAVYKRDNFTCQVCGRSKNETKIAAHHKDSFKNFIDKRSDINNGVCLCLDCHQEIHRRYGQSTTEANFTEFKNNFTIVPKT